MKIAKSILAMPLLAITVAVATAQSTKEIVQDRNQIRVDAAMLERETKELAIFQGPISCRYKRPSHPMILIEEKRGEKY